MEKKISINKNRIRLSRKPLNPIFIEKYGLNKGSRTRWINPEMLPITTGVKDGFHIIDNKIIEDRLNAIFNRIYSAFTQHKNFVRILFVGTRDISRETTKQNATRTKSFFVSSRWLGGILTNFRVMRFSIRKLAKLEEQSKDNFVGYKKKEALLLRKKMDKLNYLFEGLKDLKFKPSIIFSTSSSYEKIAITEANKLRIFTISIVDTNCSPKGVNFVIPANDDTSESIGFITTFIADAIAYANGEETLVAFKKDGEEKVLGIIEKPKTEEDVEEKSEINLSPDYQKQELKKDEEFTDFKSSEIVKDKLTKTEIEKMKLTELKLLAKELKITGYYALSKTKIIEVISKKLEI